MTKPDELKVAECPHCGSTTDVCEYEIRLDEDHAPCGAWFELDPPEDLRDIFEGIERLEDG